MARTQFRTDSRLWLSASGCLFVGLGFIDPVAGVAKGDISLWANATALVAGDYACETLDVLVPIAFLAALLAGPAAILGWVVQAVAVVLRTTWSTPIPGCADAGSRA